MKHCLNCGLRATRMYCNLCVDKGIYDLAVQRPETFKSTRLHHVINEMIGIKIDTDLYCHIAKFSHGLLIFIPRCENMSNRTYHALAHDGRSISGDLIE